MSFQKYLERTPIFNSLPPATVCRVLLVAAVFLAYLPALNGGFVWDDDSWTSHLLPFFQGFSGLGAIWSHPTTLQQYYPLTGTTFWLDFQTWNFWTPPYHLENILLHSVSAFLFWRLLLRLQVPGAWLAAWLFALHPVMVESVAWITERKNVLSLALYLGTLLAYDRFAPWVERGDDQSKTDQPDTPPAQRPVFYLLALALFLGALLAKTTAFPLPAVILLLVWWKRGRVKLKRDVVPALPFFVVAVAMCFLTAWLEKTHVGAQGEDFHLNFSERCLIAGHVPWFYLGKLLWPVNLCFVYPRWQPDPHLWWQWLYPALTVGALLALWLAQRLIGRGPATAALYFVGTLFPVLGFISAYGMRYSFVWDHWVYLSSLGFFALVEVLIVRLANWLHQTTMVYGLAVLMLSGLGVLTWHQAGMYSNVDVLWGTTLARNPNCWMAHFNWGTSLLNRNQADEAIRHFELGLKLKSDIGATYNLGVALAAQRKPDEAILSYQRAIELDPKFAPAHYNLGVVLATQGKLAEAIQQYEVVLQLKPDFAPAHYADFASAYYQLGLKLAAQEHLDEAIRNYQRGVELNPDNADVHFNYGIALGRKGQFAEAAIQYQAAMKSDLSTAGAQNDLAWTLATSTEAEMRNGAEAVRFAESACDLTHYSEPMFIGTLAAAYAEAGRFDEAVTTAQKASALAGQKGDTKLQEKNQQLLELYRAHKTYLDAPR